MFCSCLKVWQAQLKRSSSRLKRQFQTETLPPLDMPERLAKIGAVQHKALLQCADVKIGTLEKALIAKRAITKAEQIAGETV